jgi:hypothetical protein
MQTVLQTVKHCAQERQGWSTALIIRLLVEQRATSQVPYSYKRVSTIQATLSTLRHKEGTKENAGKDGSSSHTLLLQQEQLRTGQAKCYRHPRDERRENAWKCQIHDLT